MIIELTKKKERRNHFVFPFGALPHRFIREFDFLPLKFKLLFFATDIRDNVRPRSIVGSVKTAQSYCGNE